MNLTVNGSVRSVDAKPDTPLLYVLRNELGLVGSRFGCGSGQCGACFVLVDGRPIASCDLPIWSVEGKSVTTIEGLAVNGSLHPVQEAFIRHDAFQCGYCTPGQIMSAVACIDEGRTGSDTSIRLPWHGTYTD